MMLKKMVAVDPGVMNLGYAVFSQGSIRPVDAGVFDLKKELRGRNPLTPEETSAMVVNSLRRALKYYSIESFYVEKMEFRSSTRGVAAVGDVMGVVFTCGMLAAYAAERGANYVPAPVSVWKGQLSKVQVVSRIRKKLGMEEDSTLGGILTASGSHDWDAVGIGLWAKGVF